MKKMFYVLMFLFFATSAFAVSLTTNYVPKAAGGAQIKNSQIFDDATNVGIGNSTPAQKLDISGNIAIGTTGNTSGTTLSFTCDSSGSTTYPCTTYTTTNALKKGTIKVNINGTTRYINFYEYPN